MEQRREQSRARSPAKLGLKEYLQLPDDGKRYEILDGDLYVSPSPNFTHQIVLSRLTTILTNALDRKHGRVIVAPMDVVFGPNDIAQPDLMFISKTRLDILNAKTGRVEGAPDLVIEALSKSTRSRDRGVKMARYARLGVPHYWIVDPVKHSIEVYRSESGSFELVEKLTAPAVFVPAQLKGVRINLGELFEP